MEKTTPMANASTGKPKKMIGYGTRPQDWARLAAKKPQPSTFSHRYQGHGTLEKDRGRPEDRTLF